MLTQEQRGDCGSRAIGRHFTNIKVVKLILDPDGHFSGDPDSAGCSQREYLALLEEEQPAAMLRRYTTGLREARYNGRRRAGSDLA